MQKALTVGGGHTPPTPTLARSAPSLVIFTARSGENQIASLHLCSVYPLPAIYLLFFFHSKD